jgi:hypothetical protein
MAQVGFLDAVACRLVTADLRREVINQITNTLESEVSELKARQKVLARRLLGQKA